MKKFFKALAIALATIATFAFAACAKGKPVKVFKDILLTEEDYAFAIKKENDTLLNTVNDLLATWKLDGTLDRVINSYFDGTATFKYDNKSNSPANGDFVMATNAAFPPCEYKKGSSFTGVDVEIASMIATHLNKTLFVYDMDFNAIIPSVQNGESDIGMAGMTVNASRLEQVDFATPYYSSAQVITVLADDTTFDNCTTAQEVEDILAAQDQSFKVGAQNGTTGYMYSAGNADFEYDGFTNLTTKGYRTGALAFKDLSNGKINAVILDLQPSLMLASSINQSANS